MSTDIYGELFAQSDMPMALLDLRGVFVQVNPAFSAILEREADQLTGHSFREFTDVHDLSLHASSFNCLLTGEKKSVTYEHHFVRNDGESIVAQVDIGVLTKEGQLVNFYVYARDISAFKNKEEKLYERNQFLEANLQQQEDYFSIFINNSKDAFIEFNESERVSRINTAAKNLFSLDDSVINKPLCEKIFLHKHTSPAGCAFHDVFYTDTGEALSARKRLYGRDKNGRTFPVELAISSYRLDEQVFYSVFVHDISEKIDTLKKLIESKLRLNEITDNIPVLIAHVDKHINFTFLNKMYEKYFPCKIEQLLNTSVFNLYDRKFFAPQDFKIKKIYEKMTYSFEKEMNINGKTVVFNNTVVPARKLNDGFYLLTTDITEFKKLQDIYKYDANHDLLTGLPNRRAVDHYLENYRSPSFKKFSGISILFFDLNDFKKINDNYGHDVGDKTLIAFARIVNGLLRREDFFARLAGDEFLLITEGFKDARQETEALVEKIRRALDAPIVINDIPITLHASIGIAVEKQIKQIDLDKLIIEADKNMYLDKKQHKGAPQEK
ncbi:hypothetical protein A9B99_11670 [Mangrovibacter phragmitis]|uniref:Diguanylate cyclase n=1 Tax=Mangrovibacter phragmitis TaxID=1691903 RepID=A0A1B7L1A4_9ENTR|nr:sensor domain-containing diguanylate cyclase [Mangrovibacter phragmitis]OAT76097.1 hypothetical protein A9B99_11670 [Mangrovibacter phragmitis]